VVFRRDLLTRLSAEPRTASSLARELRLKRCDIEDDLQHLVRSARSAGLLVIVEPARCRMCGFTFSGEKLSKPSKCPDCRASRIREAHIWIEPTAP
jgi:predicted Zn-ribbon and HTH transcriptional regulator